MKINITYASSAGAAPAGFTTAVQAAVAFFEATYVSPITINLTFGYGEIAGQPMEDTTIGVSTPAGGYLLSYAETRAALGAAADSLEDLAGLMNLPAFDPSANGAFYIPRAQAKALGVVSPSGSSVDGYVSLSDALPFDFTPTPGSLNGKYDPISVLEHEIGHVLGRITAEGAIQADGAGLFTVLDLFRYSQGGGLNLTDPDGWFGLGPTALLKRFNNPAAGGDPADWASAGSDAFNAFGVRGVKDPISPTDYTLMNVLGLTRKPVDIAGAPGSAIVSVSGGQAVGVVGPGITNLGLIQVQTTGSAGAASSAVGVLNARTLNNSGQIIASTLSPLGETIAVKITTTQAVDITNSGDLQGQYAVYESLTTPHAAGEGVRLTNTSSGRIVGAIVLDDGRNEIRNSGAMAGDIFFGDGTSIFDGRGGRQFGHIYLGAGTSQVTLGGDGEFVFDGGGADTIAGGAGADTVSYELMTQAVTVSLGVAGAQATGGAGTDTLSGIENLYGGAGADLLTGDGGANVLLDFTGGSDTLRGGGGSDFINVYRASGMGNSTLILDGGDGDDRIVFQGDSPAYDAATLIGGAGNDAIYAFGIDAANILAGDGDDTVTLEAKVGGHAISLGAGADVLALDASNGLLFAHPTIMVSDFGADDRLDLAAYLDDVLQNYTSGADPFASGYLQIVQSGANALVQVRPGGSGASSGFWTLLELQNTAAASLFPNQTGGFVSNALYDAAVTGGAGADSLVSAPGRIVLRGLAGDDTLRGGAGADYLDGGAGVDTAVYSSVYRAYAVSVVGGSGGVAGGPEGGRDTLIGVERLKFVDGVLSTGTTDTAAQVYRIYGAALGRAPESTGLANWVRAIDQGGQGLLAVANGFIGSQEFIGRFGNGSNTQFVTLLYHNVLHRSPDSSGLQSWLTFLNSGHSRAEALTGFSESQEYIGSTAPAVEQGLWVGDANASATARLYDTVFGRLPDPVGLSSWTAALNARTATLTQVAQGFVDAKEFQTTYGALSNDQFVNLMYQNVLHRDADAGGLRDWTSALNSGRTRADVVVGFSESPEHILNTAPHIDQGVWFA